MLVRFSAGLADKSLLCHRLKLHVDGFRRPFSMQVPGDGVVWLHDVDRYHFDFEDQRLLHVYVYPGAY
jgi:hypothetical protein